MASKTVVCGGVSVGSEEMVISADVLQHHTTCMYMYTTWQTTLLKHMYIYKRKDAHSSQYAICIQFVEICIQFVEICICMQKIHHTHTCTYTVHVHSSTLWPMLEDLLLPADPEDRSRQSFTVSVLMAKKCKYLVAMPTNPLHDYN